MDNKNYKEKLILTIVVLIICFFVSTVFKAEQSIQSEEPTSINQEQSLQSQEQVSSSQNQSAQDTHSEKIEPELKVYFLDVGQADCIFVENDGQTMLIDAGNNPDGKYISKYLKKELGIKKIDYLIGTHAHEDHIGGTDIIIEDFEIGTFYMPSKPSSNKCYTDIISLTNDNGLKIISPKVGTKFHVGKAECEILTQNDTNEDYNNTSIVVQMTFGEKKFLFTGDIASQVEESRNWDDIDVLKVAHHGSVYSSSEEFLAETTPEIAVIMCGKNNDYYYPHEKVLIRLKNNNCQEIYTTSEKGTILITCDGLKCNVETFNNLSFDGNK